MQRCAGRLRRCDLAGAMLPAGVSHLVAGARCAKASAAGRSSRLRPTSPPGKHAVTHRRQSWVQLESSPPASVLPPAPSRAASQAPSGCSDSSNSPSERIDGQPGKVGSYSHSIVRIESSALIFLSKLFSSHSKLPSLGPSVRGAPDFKEKICRSGKFTLSGTIDIDRSILLQFAICAAPPTSPKTTVSIAHTPGRKRSLCP